MDIKNTNSTSLKSDFNDSMKRDFDGTYPEMVF
jgi:hypothetical protein